MDTPAPGAPAAHAAPPVAQPLPTDHADPALRARRWRRRLAVGSLAVAVGLGGVGTGVAVDRTLLGAGSGTDARGGEFALIAEAWDDLHQKYVGAADLSDRDLAYGAIEGLTEAVGDTGHTTFLTPDELKATHDALSGKYVGVGIRLDVQGDVPIVAGLVRGGSAERADVHEGDRILAVAGTPTNGLSLDDIATKVRGESGTSVSLTLERAGRSQPLVVNLERAEIVVPAVSWAMVPGSKVGMVRLEEFSSGSADQLKAALREALAAKATGLVFDLRGDPGGYVNEAVGVASQFLSDGLVYRQRDAAGAESEAKVSPGGVATTIPLVVLVDHDSASSAEIVAGALQDHERATIVGAQTFGTGTVLTEEPLADGSALRIGVVEWLTPDGHQIWHRGITPDEAVALPKDVQPVVPHDLRPMTKAQVGAIADSQLNRALEILAAAR
jgi:carboxyl-terminal processing protease